MSEAPFPHFCRFLSVPSARLTPRTRLCCYRTKSKHRRSQTHLDNSTLSGLGFLLVLLPLGDEHVDAFSCFPCTLPWCPLTLKAVDRRNSHLTRALLQHLQNTFTGSLSCIRPGGDQNYHMLLKESLVTNQLLAKLIIFWINSFFD